MPRRGARDDPTALLSVRPVMSDGCWLSTTAAVLVLLLHMHAAAPSNDGGSGSPPSAAWAQLKMARPASGYVVCLEGASGSSVLVDTYGCIPTAAPNIANEAWQLSPKTGLLVGKQSGNCVTSATSACNCTTIGHGCLCMVGCNATSAQQRWEDRALNATHSRLISSATGTCITGAADGHSLGLEPLEPDPQGPNFGFQLWIKIPLAPGPSPPPLPPPPPAPPPSPSPSPTGPPLAIYIDGHSTSLEFDGIGLLSAGGSSRYLYDYPRKQRDEILDYLFKPQFGASLDILKVEIGGDCQSTSGTEASHMHSRDDLGCSRGYEGWLLSEAIKRNPNLKSFGLSWGVPGWVGAGEFFSADNIHYQVQWLECMKTAYNISIDYIGIRNERQYGPMDYTIQLRQALDMAGHADTKIVLPDGYVSQTLVQQLTSNKTFSDAVYALGTHSCSAAPTWQGDSDSFPQKWWCTELEVRNGWGGGAGWAEYLSTNFVKSNQTSTTSWSLIWSTPIALSPYQNCGAMMAHEPWSGHYTVDAAIWMHAHWTQFTEIGWRMLTVESGSSGFLPGGSGTYVTVTSPDGSDFSIVMERLANATSMKYSIHLANLSGSKRALSLWKTSQEEYFQLDATQGHAGVLRPGPDGSVTVEIAGNCIYTLSTLTTATHGNFSGSPVPPSGNFSLPYADDFAANYSGAGVATRKEALPRLFGDQGGSFAVVNGTLMQMAPMPPGKNGWVSTFDYRDDPITMIGDLSWADVSLNVRSKFEELGGDSSGNRAHDSVQKTQQTQYVMVCGRVSVYQSYAKGAYDNDGVCLRLNASAAVGSGGGALSWQLLERSQVNTQEGYIVLRSGSVRGSQSSWHTLSLDLVGSHASVAIDGSQIASAVPVQATDGMAMLGSSYHLVQFDDFSVQQAKGLREEERRVSYM
jgi:hypothetical protein